MCSPPWVICTVAAWALVPLVLWHQEGDEPAHWVTASMTSLDLKGHTGLFTALSGTLCDYCPLLCTLPVVAFACRAGGLSSAGPSSVTIPCGDSLRRTGCFEAVHS